ncbi:fluoride efflux transporter FluC [Arthrobacter sp. R4-81]
MTTALLVGLFGMVGALLRFAVDTLFAHRTDSRSHWPWATFLVNMTGSLIIGLSLGITGRLGLGPELQVGLATGLAGGLTTFSSWTTATVRLVSEQRFGAAALNVTANLLAGLAAAGVGIMLAS